MDTRLFEEKEHAEMYALYRPTYPDSIYKKVVDFCGNGCSREVAVDVCCGGGQSTLPLTDYFRRVIGTDASAEQIASAKTFSCDKIEFIVAVAEDLNFLQNECVDLVTVATGLHWLDRVAFYKEATRVLKPGGVLAVYGYTNPELEDEDAQKLLDQFYNEVLRNYWSERVLNRDKDIELPFPGWIRLDGGEFDINKNLSVDDFIGYLSTISSYRAYLKDHPDSSYLESMKQRMSEVISAKIGDAAKPCLHAKWPVYFLLGKKPE